MLLPGTPYRRVPGESSASSPCPVSDSIPVVSVRPVLLQCPVHTEGSPQRGTIVYPPPPPPQWCWVTSVRTKPLFVSTTGWYFFLQRARWFTRGSLSMGVHVSWTKSSRTCFPWLSKKAFGSVCMSLRKAGGVTVQSGAMEGRLWWAREHKPRAVLPRRQTAEIKTGRLPFAGFDNSKVNRMWGPTELCRREASHRQLLD